MKILQHPIEMLLKFQNFSSESLPPMQLRVKY